MPEVATLENMTEAVMYLDLQNYINFGRYTRLNLDCEVILKAKGINKKIATLIDQLHMIRNNCNDNLSDRERENVLYAKYNPKSFSREAREKILTAECNQKALSAEQASAAIYDQINVECDIGSKILESSIVEEIDTDKWNTFYERYSDCATKMQQIVVFDNFRHDVSERLNVDGVTFFGFPINMCRFHLPADTGLEKIQLELCAHPLHVDIYRGICEYHIRGGFVFVDEIKRTISNFDSTKFAMHCNFGKVYELVKYELVVLEKPRNFCRLQEKESLDIKNSKISIYWFDANDFPQLALIDEFYSGIVQGPIINEINSKLAIECDWYSPNYLVEYEFPPGAMFLKCRVAPQKSRIGGGFEYVYLNNVPNEEIWKQSVLSTKETLKPIMARVIGGGDAKYVPLPHIMVGGS